MNKKNTVPMFSSNLKYYLAVRKISQSRLASLIHVSNNTVCQWCNGKREPSLFYLISISCVLNVSIDELCGANKIHFFALNLADFLYKHLNDNSPIGD